MYLAHRLGGWSTIRIGKFYNGRDHSTVCYGIRRIEALRQSNREVERLLTELMEEIEQIRRGRGRSLPVTVQRQIEQTETVAWTDEMLDGLAERIARRIQAILLTGCDST
jgi:chromosomal replication initiation ATPase DnaA